MLSACPGIWRVEVGGEAWIYRHPAAISVLANEETSVVVDSQTVSGILAVRSSDGRKLSSGSVALYWEPDDDSSGQVVQLDSDGESRVTLAPGTYFVREYVFGSMSFDPDAPKDPAVRLDWGGERDQRVELSLESVGE